MFEKQRGRWKKWRTVINITVCWVMFSCISFISQYFFIYDLIALKRLTGSFPFWHEFTGSLVFGIFGGLACGYLLVFKMGSRYRRRSFIFGILNSGFLFILSYILLIVFGLFIIDFVYFSFCEDLSSALSRSVNNVLFNVLSPSFFINVLLFGLLVSCT